MIELRSPHMPALPRRSAAAKDLKSVPITHVVALIAALALLATACGSSATVPTASTTSTVPAVTTTTAIDPRTPVILDYSPTVSDVGALVLLARHPDLRLIAVTLPGTGESHCEPGVAHTRGALVALGLADVPVACGPEEGVGPLNSFPDGWRERSDVIDLPEAEPNETRSAPALIVDLVAGSSVPVEIVAVGPLTNLAEALREHPEVLDGIAGFTIMGGAVHVPGNVPPVPGWESVNQYAEVNFWVDPSAAALVVGSGAPITLVPLDATNGVPVDGVFYEGLISEPSTPASVLMADVWAQAPEWVTDGYFFWDELAAAVLADSSLVTMETRRLTVEDGSSPDAARVREDPDGMSVRVAVSADRSAFERLFLSTVLDRPVDLGRPVVSIEQEAYFGGIAGLVSDFDVALERVFVATAAELGIDPTDDELTQDDFAQMALTAAPTILDGPATDLVTSLRVVAVPPEFEGVHALWVGAWEDLLEHRSGFLSEFEAALTSDPPGEVLFLTRITDACSAVQGAGADRGLTVELNC